MGNPVTLIRGKLPKLEGIVTAWELASWGA